MNNPTITAMAAERQTMPLIAPFVTAKGRSEHANSVVIRLAAEGGIEGLGAVTPAKYVTGESVEDVQASLTAMAGAVAGAGLWDHARLFQDLRADFPAAHAARAGVEIAVMDAFGKSIRQPLWRHWGGRAESVNTDLTVPLNSLEEARTVAAEAARAGIRHLKIKVNGEDAAASLERVLAVHASAPQALLLVDANQSFTPDGARAFLAECAGHKLPIHLFEQPVDAKDIEGLGRVAEGAPFPVGADEAVITPEDCRAVLDAGVRVVNVKLMKSGISGALEIIRMCQQAGVTLMLGCMVESGIGIGAAVHLACGTAAFSYHDLDAPLLLARDNAEGAFTLEGDTLRPSNDPGLGVRLREPL